MSKVFAATFNRVLLYVGHPDIFRRIAANAAANRLGDEIHPGKKWRTFVAIYFNGVEKKTIVGHRFLLILFFVFSQPDAAPNVSGFVAVLLFAPAKMVE